MLLPCKPVGTERCPTLSYPSLNLRGTSYLLIVPVQEKAENQTTDENSGIPAGARFRI
jgi:hypothetical protein